MNLNKTLLVFTLAIGSVVNGQLFNTVYNTGASYDDIAISVAVDSDGSLITAGVYEVDTDMDPGPDDYELLSVGFSTDIYIQKLDADGDFLWAKSIGGSEGDYVRNMHIAEDGSIYLTGYFQGTCDFDPSGDTFELTAVGGWEIFTAKFDDSGELIWAVSMGGTNHDQGLAVLTDADNNVYTCGSYQATADFDPGAGTSELTALGSNQLFIQKMNSSGNFEWVKEISCTTQSSATSMIFDEAGNLFVCGTFRGTGDFDPGAGEFIMTEEPMGWSSDAFILKLDADQEFLWAKHIGGGQSSVSNDLAVDSEGNVLLAGSFTENIDLNPGDGVQNLTATGVNNDMFLLKLDVDGEYVWGRQFECSDYIIPWGIAVDYAGNSIVTGRSRGTADFDPGAGVESQPGAGDWDAFIVKVDKDGAYSFHQQMGSPSQDQGYDVCVDLSGQIYAVGSFRSTVDFDGSADVFEEVAVNKNAYILLLESDCAVVNTIYRSGGTLISDAIDHNYQWINCADNSFIEGETAETFTPSSNGEYACIIDNGDCNVISNCITIGDVGLGDNEMIQVELYPNPFSTSTTLRFKEAMNGSQNLVIYDMLGNEVYRESNLTTQELEISRNNLSNGMYALFVLDTESNQPIFSTQLVLY